MYRMTSKILAAVLGVLIPAASLHAQQKPTVRAGNEALMVFVFAGKPIHPFCLDFPFDSSRNTPVELARCNDSKVEPTRSGTRWSADYPNEDGGFRLRSSGITYDVLASKGDRFLIWSDHSGGGSGQFTDVFWVRLDSRQITLVKTEISGDRCAGHVSVVRTEASAVLLSQTVSTVDILKLAGGKFDDALGTRLRSGYAACDGEAYYRYDLNTEKMSLTSVSLGQNEPANGDPLDPQNCFDRLVQEYAKSKNVELNPTELNAFGRKFFESCAKPASAWTAYLKHVGPLQIGMSLAQVRQILGDPSAKLESPEDDVRPCSYLRSSKLPKGVALMFAEYRLARIDIENPAIRTASGGGVGDSEAQILKLYAGKLQVDPHKYLGPEGHYLRYIPQDAGDKGYELLFETDGKKVLEYRTGKREQVGLVEGCL